MKKTFKFILVIAVVTTTALAFIPVGDTITELPIGSAMPKPTVKMKDAVSGKEVCLNDAKKENGLVVIFSCNTCPFVVKYEDRMKACYETAVKSKMGYILINSNEALREKEDSFEAMKTHAKDNGYKFSYVVDNSSQLADDFGATRTPHVFIFDKNRKCVYHGGIDDNANEASSAKEHYLIDAITAIAAGKTITNHSTKSIGCTIKRKK